MKILRTELYEKIWSIGISKTANELNVPYNKLKSACSEHDIPLPSPKYWGVLYMGKETPVKTQLPNPEENIEILINAGRPTVKKIKEISTPIKVSISKVEAKTAYNKPVTQHTNYFDYFSSEEQMKLIEAFNSLKMNKTLSKNPHREIIKFKQKQKNPDSYFYKREPKLIIKSASEEIFPEAFIFIDSLFKALEKANATIVTTLEKTQVHYKHYIFSLSFKIPATKVSLMPDDKDYTTYKTYKYVSKEILSIEIDRNERWHPNFPRTTTISQKANESFEELLKRLFIKVFSLAPIDDEVKRLRMIEEEEKKKEAEERARIKEIHAYELAKTESLITNSLNYYLYKLIKDYIDAEIDKDSEEFTWAINKVNWIKNSTEQTDPILTDEDKARLIMLFINGGSIK